MPLQNAFHFNMPVFCSGHNDVLSGYFLAVGEASRHRFGRTHRRVVIVVVALSRSALIEYLNRAGRRACERGAQCRSVAAIAHLRLPIPSATPLAVWL